MTSAEIRQLLADPEELQSRQFEVLKALCLAVNRQEPEAQELVLRALEVQDSFNGNREVLDGLVRSLGLFPYLDPDTLSTRDLLAYEYHRPINFDKEDVVFHRVQGDVYHHLLAGRSVVLSAPTSFGKSLIIDAVIATEKYRNIMVVVPSIALIDETRRRLTRFRDRYKVITHPSQQRADKNIFVFTQERVVDAPDLPKIDFFVIDEFYKLSPTRMDEGRSLLLNQAVYKLMKQGGQFYMLGPNIKRIPEGFAEDYECIFKETSYQTVVSELTRIRVRPAEQLQALSELALDLKEPTLIYCASPMSVRKVTNALLATGRLGNSDTLSSAAHWIGEQFHPEWLFGRALRHGVGMHHGKLPRSLATFVVRAFNEERLRYLACTSTLIEGVNTKAKNVIVFDNKIARSKFDYFTFNNIRGRSGRMFQHFIGRVFVFHDPPEADLPEVDIPMYTQDEKTPESLLIQIDPEDLTDHAKARVDRYVTQSELSLETLRANSGIDPEFQLELARELRSKLAQYSRTITWRGFPRFEQLAECCQLILKFLYRRPGWQHGVKSGRQLAFKLNTLSIESMRGLIDLEVKNAETADDGVESALDFARYWASHNLPQYLRALNRIQKDVFERVSVTPGEYSFYAGKAENYFRSSAVSILEEYGLPMQVSTLIEEKLIGASDIDAALAVVKSLDYSQLDLGPFERELIADVIQYL